MRVVLQEGPESEDVLAAALKALDAPPAPIHPPDRSIQPVPVAACACVSGGGMRVRPGKRRNMKALGSALWMLGFAISACSPRVAKPPEPGQHEVEHRPWPASPPESGTAPSDTKQMDARFFRTQHVRQERTEEKRACAPTVLVTAETDPSRLQAHLVQLDQYRPARPCGQAAPDSWQCVPLASGPIVVTDLDSTMSENCGLRVGAIDPGDAASPSWFLSSPLFHHGARLLVKAGQSLFVAFKPGVNNANASSSCVVLWAGFQPYGGADGPTSGSPIGTQYAPAVP